MVRLDAVVLPNHRRVEVKPTAVLRCAMAESFAAWVRDEASAHIATLGVAQRGIETYGSYECRGRNSVSDAKLSEHGKGNAIDVRALILAADRRIELTDETVAKPLREALRDLPVIALPRCWDRAPTAITITTSISTFLSELMAFVFANGMCVSCLRRRPRSQAHMLSSPPRRDSLSRSHAITRPSLSVLGQSQLPTRQTSSKAVPCAVRGRTWNNLCAHARRVACHPRLAEMEARSRQGLFCSSICRLAICRCKGLG